MQQTTKIYENTTAQPINVLGVGVIPPYDRLSITTEYHAPVNLANYPGVIDVLADEAANGPAPSAEDRAKAQNPVQVAAPVSTQAQEVQQNV